MAGPSFNAVPGVEVRREFCTTHWSVVLSAAQPNGRQAEGALEKLCLTYWFPLYAYVRRQGHPPHDAQDLTQEFFARLLKREFLARVGPEKGHFRSFLVASMNNFLANEWDRIKAEKRGGSKSFISIDDDSAEGRYVRDGLLDEGVDVDHEFDRRWAVALLEAALQRLEAEAAKARKSALFERLKGFLEADPLPGEYGQLAAELRWTTGAIAVAVHRLRARYRELIADEVAQTLAQADGAEAELQRLLKALQSGGV